MVVPPTYLPEAERLDPLDALDGGRGHGLSEPSLNGLVLLVAGGELHHLGLGGVSWIRRSGLQRTTEWSVGSAIN